MNSVCLRAVRGATFLWIAVAASAAEAPKYEDALLLGGQRNRISGASAGGSESVDWLRTGSDGSSYSAGAARFHIAGSTWAMGRAGVSFRPSPHTIFSGQGSLGAGTSPTSSFPFQRLRGEFAYIFNPRLSARGGVEYLRVAETRGWLLSTGALAALPKRNSLDLSYAASAGGNLNSEFATARWNVDPWPVRFFAGISYGHVTPEILNLSIGARARAQIMRQAFSGVIIPVQRVEFTLSAETLRLAQSSRQIFSVSIRIPLKGTR